MTFLISAANSLGLKVIPFILQLVLIVTLYLGASINCKVPSIASSVQTIGKQLPSCKQQLYFYPNTALWKISTAQSVVPPPGGERYPTKPGYLMLLTSTPYLEWQQEHHSSPDFLVIPQTVLGSIIVNWEVLLGALDPKAAMELGQNNFLICPSLASYRQLKRPFMLMASVLRGSFSPVADSRAAKEQTSLTLCFLIIEASWSLLRISKVSCVATQTFEGGCLMSEQMTLLSPILAESALISSWPTCPQAPINNTFMSKPIIYIFVNFIIRK